MLSENKYYLIEEVGLAIRFTSRLLKNKQAKIRLISFTQKKNKSLVFNSFASEIKQLE